MEKESTITIALTGRRAVTVLEQHGVNPKNFVIGIGSSKQPVVETSLGKVGVAYSLTNHGENRQVTLTLNDIPAMKSKEIQVSVNRRGEGSQQIGRGLEVVIVTDATLRQFCRKQK